MLKGQGILTFNPPDKSEIQAALPTITTLDQIGGGGFKAVYRAEIFGNPETFKLVHIPEATESDESIRRESYKRIMREVEALGKCQRPQLVKLGSLQPQLITINGKDYVAYSEEYLDGLNLRQGMQSQQAGRPAEDELKVLFLSLLKAIEELWSLGYVHRDIKPENVMKLNVSNRPFVLLDLGIAFSVYDTPLTYDAENRWPPGTLWYLAPEMFGANFRERIDFRSDLYTAGVTVYEYAVSQHPLARHGDDPYTTLSRILRKKPLSLQQLRNDLSAEFCSRIDQMLKKRPALRPSRLNNIINELESGL